MKNRFIFLVLLCLAVVASCKKEDNVTSLDKRILSYVTNKGACLLVEFSYDNQGRLVSRKSCNIEFTYIYFSDSIRFTRWVNGVEDYYYIFSLNADGTVSGYDRFQGGTKTSAWAFEYDSEKCRTKRIQIDDTANYTLYKIIDRNVVEERLFSTVDADETTRLTEYYTDKQNSLSYTNYGTTFFGTSSANLKRREVLITTQGIAEFGYTYEFDADGYVTKSVAIVPGVDTLVTRYTYQ